MISELIVKIVLFIGCVWILYTMNFPPLNSGQRFIKKFKKTSDKNYKNIMDQVKKKK